MSSTTKADLVNHIAGAAGIKKVQAEAALDAMTNGIKSALANGNKVTLVGFGTVAHFGFEGDVLFHPVHGAGFGDDGFARVQFDFDDLHIVAKDFVVYFLTAHCRSPFFGWCG